MIEEVSTKIEKFFDQYKLKHYSKGQILILDGEGGDYVYHLIEGKVKQYDVTYRGDEIILNIFKPPAFFPMSLAINKVRNPYIYEAETDVDLKRAPAEDAVKFIKKNPDVLYNLLSRVYLGADGMLGRMSHLMASSARSRLIYELILECRRFGALQDDGSYRLEVNEKDMGSRAGLSRETVNREVHKLKEEDMITVSRTSVVVKNLSALEKKLGKEI